MPRFAFSEASLLRVNYSAKLRRLRSPLLLQWRRIVSAWWNSAEITVYGANTEPKELRLGDRALAMALRRCHAFGCFYRAKAHRTGPTADV